jgi:hypothetical protein
VTFHRFLPAVCSFEINEERFLASLGMTTHVGTMQIARSINRNGR